MIRDSKSSSLRPSRSDLTPIRSFANAGLLQVYGSKPVANCSISYRKHPDGLPIRCSWKSLTQRRRRGLDLDFDPPAARFFGPRGGLIGPPIGPPMGAPIAPP